MIFNFGLTMEIIFDSNLPSQYTKLADSHNESMVNLEITAILTIFTFIIILAILVTEKIDKTALALIGATIVSVVLFLFPHQALHDPEIVSTPFLLKRLPWDTVFFIFTMMLIVAISSRSGLFQWLAIISIQITKGRSKTLYITFILLTFIVSFFFDTVSTMLIIAPLTIEIMNVLDRPSHIKPYLITEAVVANFGSIGSLIGSVPNIIIGDVAELSFIQFFVILGPLAIILLVVSIPILFFFNRSFLYNQEELEDMDNRIFALDASLVINNSRLFIISILGFVILVVGFTFGQLLPIPISPVLTAMIAMSFLLIATRDQIPENLKEVQWETIFFIIGLLFIVQAMEELAVILFTSQLLEPLIEELGPVLMIWVGGLLSGAVDNIPISAAFAPIAKNLGEGAAGAVLPLALIFGVNVGGYLTPIASPANILAITFAEKENKPISFIEFAKIGSTLSILHLIIGSLYFVFIVPLLSGFL